MEQRYTVFIVKLMVPSGGQENKQSISCSIITETGHCGDILANGQC